MKRPVSPVVGSEYRIVSDGLIYFSKNERVILRELSVDGSDLFESEEVIHTISWSDLEPLEKTLDDLEKGDVVVISEYERTILARLEDCFLLSAISNNDQTGLWITLSSMKKNGYHFKSPTKVKVTMEEVAAALGREVGTFEIENIERTV